MVSPVGDVEGMLEYRRDGRCLQGSFGSWVVCGIAAGQQVCGRKSAASRANAPASCRAQGQLAAMRSRMRRWPRVMRAAVCSRR